MIAFVPLHEGALDQVLQWRTDPEVTRFMCTDVAPDPARQRIWFARVSADPTCVHWLIRRDGVDVGLASLTEIDPAVGRCSCGFYIGEPTARKPLGGVILPAIVNHVFGQLNFHKIHGEVLDINENVRRLHLLFGYRAVGVMKEHVVKDGQRHDLHLFELLRSEWLANQVLFKPFRIPVQSAGDGAP